MTHTHSMVVCCIAASHSPYRMHMYHCALNIANKCHQHHPCGDGSIMLQGVDAEDGTQMNLLSTAALHIQQQTSSESIPSARWHKRTSLPVIIMNSGNQ